MQKIVEQLDRSWQAIVAEAPELTGDFVAMVLGSGLGAVVDELKDARVIPYAQIPGFPSVGVAGHAGELVVGRWEGQLIAGRKGHAHLYEGWSPTEVVHAVRTLVRGGARALMLTNAAGGVNPALRTGDLMVIRDHINLSGRNPLVGPSDPELGPRFPDMTHTWSEELSDALHAAAQQTGHELKDGVYVGLLGPSYETPAEVQMLARMGGDAGGMSTVLEAIAARHMGCSLLGVSVISNAAAGTGEPDEELDHADVATAAITAGAALVDALRVLSQRGWRTRT